MRRMMLGDEANLARGLSLGVHHQMEFDERMRAERVGERAAGLVVAHDADEDAACAESDQIARDVAGAADHQFAALNGNHRRGRFRRDARHLAIDELVEHQIADAEYGLIGERGEMLVEIEHYLYRSA